MAPRFQAFVDRLLADQHGITVAQLHEPGIRFVAGPAGHDRISAMRIGESVLITTPDGVHPFGQGLGPSRHHFLHRDDFDRALAPGTARRVEWSDAVAAFRDAVGLDDFHEGGFGSTEVPEVAWAVHDDDGGIVAMGNMTDFAGSSADVGLATHPAARGTGAATALAADMLVAAFDAGVEVARYRALTTNHASLAVAGKLGFVGYGENIVFRPQPVG